MLVTSSFVIAAAPRWGRRVRRPGTSAADEEAGADGAEGAGEKEERARHIRMQVARAAWLALAVVDVGMNVRA